MTDKPTERNPAEELRAAARLLGSAEEVPDRHLRWTYTETNEHKGEGTIFQGSADADGTWHIASCVSSWAGPYIALMWPGVALALRDHLDQSAERAEAMAYGVNKVPWRVIEVTFASDLKIARALQGGAA